MLWLFAALPFALSVLPDSSRPFMRQELIMPPESLHNHGSCLVETPKGQILACWYRGSGERQADDVQVLGARLNPKREGKGETIKHVQFNEAWLLEGARK